MPGGLTTRAAPTATSAAAAALVALVTVAGCNGSGTGQVRGTVTVPICQMSGAYDLAPDFFGVDRVGDTLFVRIMRGGGPAEYSDNLVLTVTDAPSVARQLDAATEVTLPVGPPYTPGVIVHAVFYPNWSCGRHRVTRIAENVGLPVHDGSITFRRIDRGPNAPPSADGVDPRTIDVTAFTFSMSDPRPIGSLMRPLGSPAYDDMLDPSTPVGSAELSGSFRTVFDRGRPSQLFP